MCIRDREKVITLEEALKRIEELENENAELREELEFYKNRKLTGNKIIVNSHPFCIMLLPSA